VFTYQTEVEGVETSSECGQNPRFVFSTRTDVRPDESRQDLLQDLFEASPWSNQHLAGTRVGTVFALLDVGARNAAGGGAS